MTDLGMSIEGIRLRVRHDDIDRDAVPGPTSDEPGRVRCVSFQAGPAKPATARGVVATSHQPQMHSRYK